MMNTYQQVRSLQESVSPLVNKLLGSGQTKVELGRKDLVENDITISPMSNGRLDSPHILVGETWEGQLVTPEFHRVTKKRISNGKLNTSRVTILQSTKLSQTSGRASTTTEEDSVNFYPRWKKEVSPWLWLPTGTVCVDSDLNSSKESLEKVILNSWFSVTKVTVRSRERLNLPMIYSTSVTSSLLEGTEEKQQHTEKKDLRIRAHRLYISKELKKIMIRWFHVTRWVYNQCVQWYLEHAEDKPTLKILRNYTINSSKIHDSCITKMLSDVPYDVKDSGIRDFMKALTTQKKLVKEGKKKHFTMKFRSRKDMSSFSIPHKYLKLEGTLIKCFPKFLGSLKLRVRERIKEIKHDTRITWNSRNVFEIHIPTDIKEKPMNLKYNVCSIDPGEKIFCSVYGSDGDSYLIGNNGFNVDRMASVAARMRNGIQMILVLDKSREFKESDSRRTRKHLQAKAKDLETRCKHMISDIHRKTVKFLTSKYDTIIIPEFKTQQMVNKTEGRQINRGVSRRLIRWSHYRFRELLRAKGGSRIIVGTEEWTSKTCGNCFGIHKDLGSSRAFVCPFCDARMHRDLNAARNIMTLNWDKASLEIQCPVPQKFNQ